MLPGMAPVVTAAAAGGDVVSTYLGEAHSGSSLTVYTFTSMILPGATGSVVCVSVITDGADSISGATVDGNSATQRATYVNGGQLIQYWTAASTANATGNVVVTCGDSANRCAISVWQMDNLESEVPTDIKSDGATDPSVSMNIEAGGCCFGHGYNGGGESGITWSGITEDFEDGWTGNWMHTAASDDFAAEQTGLTVSINTNSKRIDMLVVAFR